MNSQPPSQIQTAPIFVKPDGTRLSVFAQADGNVNRPKLARRLRTGGAATCTNPKLADVILVNPNHTDEDTDELSAQAIIDAWGDSKVILDYRWAKHCLEEGRLMLEEDNWGGFRIQAGAGGPYDEDDGEGALPTPRPSPENGQQQQNAQAGAHTADPTLAPSQLPQPNDLLQALSTGDNAALQYYTPDLLMSLCDVMSQQADPKYQALAQQLRGMAPVPKVSSESSAMASASCEGSVTSEHGPGPSAPPSRTSSEEPLRGADKSTGKARSKSFFARYGKPLGFFVQIDHSHRREIISTVKAHGGAVQKDIAKADVAVLYSAAPSGTPKAREYAALYKTANAAKIPCVGAQYVRDCQAKQRLLDWQKYASKDPEKKRKKSMDVEPESESDSDDEPDVPLAKRQATEEAIRVKPKAKPKPTPSSTPKLTSKPASKPAPPLSPPPPVQEKVNPTPAPPQRKTAPIPPQHEIQSRINTTRYTDAEYQRAWEIALEMYSDDPDASQEAIAARFVSEMPGHPKNSWKTTMFYRFKARMAEVQHKGRIQFNKRQRLERKMSVNLNGGPSNVSMPPESPIEPSPRIPSRKELEQQDMEDIVNFFAIGEDEEFGEGEERDQNRSAIFEKLENRVQCRSAASWTAFYNSHWQRVQELLTLALADTAET